MTRLGITADRLPLIGLAILIVSGWLYADWYLGTVSVISPSPFLQVWAGYSSAAVATLIVWILAALLLAAIIPMGRLTWKDLSELAERDPRWVFFLWVSLALGSVVLAFYIHAGYILYAPYYLAVSGPAWLVSLAGTLQPAGILAAGVVSKDWKVISLLLLVAWGVVTFASGTRVFAGVLLLFLIGRALVGVHVGMLTWLSSLTLAILSFPAALISRNLPSHGLVPYAHALWPMLHTTNYYAQIGPAVAQNIGFTAPILLFTSEQTRINASDMMISLNPGPSSMVGWDRIATFMRVHQYIPYSSLGEFARFGGLALFCWVLWWAIVVRMCLVSVSRGRHALVTLMCAAELGMGLISMVLLTQYNTRAVSRVLSMMIALAMVERFFRHRHLLQKRKSSG